MHRITLTANRTFCRQCATDRAVTLVDCGTPATGFDVQIVDPRSRRPLPDDHVGEIWSRGNSIAAGAMKRCGIDTYPILYPAVPADRARLRIFVTALHTDDQIRYAVKSLAEQLEILNAT